MTTLQKLKRALKKGSLIKKRAYLTLIELLIVLALIGMSLSIVAFPMKNTFEEWRYRKGLDELSQTLHQAKFISVCYCTDCHVVLSNNSNGEVEFWIESLEPLTQVIKKRHSLYGAKKVLSEKNQIQRISFFASGFHRPENQIVIMPTKKSLSVAEIKLIAPFAFTTDIPEAISSEDLD